MTYLLLVVICIAFIGLGIPDSLFGAVWPAIYPEFGVSVSRASWVTCLIYLGTITSSLLSSRVISRFGTPKVTLVCTFATALALLGFSLSPNLFWMMLFAIPLGLGGGSVDTGLNNYVAQHYEASHMSYLHCFYGIGVTISPWILSVTLTHSGWRQGYQAVFFIQIAIALVILVSLPLWKRVADTRSEEPPMEVLSVRQILALPGAPQNLLVYLGSCSIEAIVLSYGSTYLTHRGLTPAAAAGTITLYYLGMTLGRLLSGLVSNRLHSRHILIIGESICALAIVLLFLPGTHWAALGLFLIGLGNGPAFPNLTHLVPIFYGRAKSQAFLGLQGAVANTAFLCLPVITGLLIQSLNAGVVPLLLLAAMALTGISTGYTLRFHKT